MKNFKVGDTVFYFDDENNKIESRIINGWDLVDGVPRYWLQGYFGYFNEDRLFETAQEAQDKLNRWNKLNDEFTKD